MKRTHLLIFIILLTSCEKKVEDVEINQEDDFQWIWTKTFGSSEYDAARNFVIDKDGNIILLGTFEDLFYIDNISFLSEGYTDIYIAKYDSSGNLIWAKKAGGSFEDEGNGICTDNDGNIYITGFFSGLANFGDFSLSTGDITDTKWNIFIAKLDSDGNWKWVKGIGEKYNYDSGHDIKFKDDYLYITGSSNLYTLFDDEFTISNGQEDVFICKYNKNGDCIWVKSFGGSWSDSGNKISISNSNIFITGQVSSYDIEYDGNIIDNTNHKDMFIAKIDQNGNWGWFKNFGNFDYSYITDICIDDLENNYIIGVFSGQIYFDNFTLTSNGDSDTFIAKIDQNGNWLWAKNIGGVSTDGGYGVLYKNNSIFLTGCFSSNIIIGSDTLTSIGGTDVYAAEMNREGNVIWSLSLGGSSPNPFSSYGYGLSAESGFDISSYNEYFYLSGSFMDNIQINDENLSSKGKADGFISKFKK